MSKFKRPKTLAEQIADLDDPAPKDFDPEDVGLYNSGSEHSGSDEEDGEDNARAHYESVGKSRLRKPEGVSLGPQYSGSRISRDAIEDDDSDDPFGREYSDENSEEEEVVGGAQRSSGDDEESEDEDASEVEFGNGVDTSGTELSEEEEDEDVEFSKKEQENGIDRSELRKLMAHDQKSVAATITEGAKADVEKGQAVKRQRTTFDTLLNTRIKLQKALVSVNSLAEVGTGPNEFDASRDVVSSAENAALKLWNNLNSLRSDLQSTRTGEKRKISDFTSDNPLSRIWKESSSYETEQSAHRNSSLNFWSAKCRATAVLPQARGRLNQASNQQSLTDVLAAQMGDMPRLMARTRIPRSCAPLQAASAAKKPATTNGTTDNDIDAKQLPIYDDADFYSTLLQSLISQRSSETTTSLGNLNLNLQPWQAAREAKTKKAVDTKASKGRKLRYTVHEKLQNFMAPEDRRAWGERQADELFGSLFGRRVGLGEAGDFRDEEIEDETELAAEGLRLFAGA